MKKWSQCAVLALDSLILQSHRVTYPRPLPHIWIVVMAETLWLLGARVQSYSSGWTLEALVVLMSAELYLQWDSFLKIRCSVACYSVLKTKQLLVCQAAVYVCVCVSIHVHILHVHKHLCVCVFVSDWTLLKQNFEVSPISGFEIITVVTSCEKV